MENNKENTEGFYVLTEEFEWTNDIMKSSFAPYPIEGRVYYAEPYRDGGFALVINKGEGILIPELEAEMENFRCRFTKVDEDAFIEYDLCKEDMDMMLNKSHYAAKSNDKTAVKELTPNEASDLEMDAEVLEHLADVITDMYNDDKDNMYIIGLMVTHIAELLKSNNASLTDSLSLSEGREGRVANIAIASQYLEEHLNSSDRNPVSLLGAIFAIFKELKRTIGTNNIDNE